MSKLTKGSGGMPPKKFRLDKVDAKLAGVCGGIANYAGVDPMIVRIGFVVGALMSAGTAALVYLIIALIAD